MSVLPQWKYGDPVDVAERTEALAIKFANRVIEEARQPRVRSRLCLAVKRARIRALVAEVMRAMGK